MRCSSSRAGLREQGTSQPGQDAAKTAAPGTAPATPLTPTLPFPAQNPGRHRSHPLKPLSGTFQVGPWCEATAQSSKGPVEGFPCGPQRPSPTVTDESANNHARQAHRAHIVQKGIVEVGAAACAKLGSASVLSPPTQLLLWSGWLLAAAGRRATPRERPTEKQRPSGDGEGGGSLSTPVAGEQLRVRRKYQDLEERCPLAGRQSQAADSRGGRGALFFGPFPRQPG